ncbi:MAG: SCO family protein [Candidatus Dormibacteraeota bacterium]|nr:SCO family protein [Candidatus Dormibacteraeota bacterium]
MALACASLAAVARADGDPASDYLQTNQVFLAAQTPAASASERHLLSVVAAANRAGFAIRVAVVGSRYDLGSITALWQKPRLYARFLGMEVSSIYRQRLLVVMPNGYGFSWPGHPIVADYRELAHVPSGGTDLPATAQAAVRRLAAGSGVRLAAPAPAPGQEPVAPGGGISVVLIGVLAGLLAAVTAWVVVWRRRRQARPSSHSRGRSSWAIPGFAALCLAAFAVPVGVLVSTRHSSAAGTSTSAVVTPPPVSWPSGARPAPAFTLRDQHGQPVSVRAYRGRTVIVTFVDPLCRALCPLEAHVLNAAVRQLPGAQRPAILAVSVDVYANRRADLLQDVRKWSLVPEWHWAVGSRAALSEVWRSYKVGVSVVTKKIAGNTINYITHTEAAYVIDTSGHERAVFVWPFYPQDVVRTLRQLS